MSIPLATGACGVWRPPAPPRSEGSAFESLWPQVLVLYGFLPTLQPLADFGRLYAVYGGVFIVLSYAWGSVVDGMQIDRGDLLGSGLALAGVCVALFWPR